MAVAQVISVTGATANGMSNAIANDFLVPAPPPIGDAIFDAQSCILNDFTAGLFGNDYGTICFVHAQEEGNFPFPHKVSSYIGSRAFINGNNSNAIQIKWKNTGANYASSDGYYAEIQTTLNVNVNMQVTGVPDGTPVTVYWWYDIFGGGSTAHEAAPPDEDSISVVNTMTVNGVDQFNNNQFSFTSPAGVPGWNEWKNVTGAFRIDAGVDFNFGVTSNIRLFLNEPPKPGGNFGVDQNDGIFRGSITFTVVGQYPQPVSNTEDMLTLFSLDIGSDTELSDPQMDGNEFFDPGDLYPKSIFPLPVITPWINDSVIFQHDPDPKTIPPVNPAPVGSGLAPGSVSGSYFDMDGCDLLEFSLSGILPNPGDASIAWFSDSCIYEAEYVFVSFDDDIPEHYTDVTSVPVNSNSPAMNTIYPGPGLQDELQEFDYDPWPVSGPSFQKDIFSEVLIHANLDPDPAGNNSLDDDIDALDMIPITAGLNTPCNQYYFSADHEATYNHPLLFPNFVLDPATIYTTSPAGPVPVIDNTHHGLPTATDIDAFEFAWVWDFDEGRYGLAMLFSVDDDDPLTADDESGGLDSRMIYFTFMNGGYEPFSAAPQLDDIDGMVVWPTSLNGTMAFPSPIAGTKTWTGSSSDQWQDPLNWFPQGVPFDPEDVTIPNVIPYPLIGVSGLDCRSVEVATGAQVRLQSGQIITIKGL
jgi:hypothetical protein